MFMYTTPETIYSDLIKNLSKGKAKRNEVMFDHERKI